MTSWRATSDPQIHADQIIDKYVEFCNRLRGLGDLDVKDDPPDLNDNITDSGVEITCGRGYFIIFRGVKFHPRNIDFKGDICVDFREVVQPEIRGSNVKYQIVESNTAVAYLRYEGGRDPDSRLRNVSLTRAYHFDYRNDPREDHPIFHVHYDPMSINLVELQQLYHIKNTTQIRDDSISQNFPRLPSAPMDLSAIVYMIITEHQEVEPWPKELHRPVRRLPKFDENSFAPKPQNGRLMWPEWWYIHCKGADHLDPKTKELRE